MRCGPPRAGRPDGWLTRQIQMVAGEIPPELGTPELMPITTGLGEIYQTAKASASAVSP